MTTIFSLVTKPINQNVAIIRISGPKAFFALEELTKEKRQDFKPLRVLKLSDKEFIDDVIILSFKNPNSFTGEDVVEIQCHGSMFVVKKILSLLHNIDFLRQANNGEFMKQAFENNKINLLQSEAINTLIKAENETLANQSSLNLNNNQTNIIKKFINDLKNIIAIIQITIDYPENSDLPKYSSKNLEKNLLSFHSKIETIINDSKKLLNISKGIKIAFVGKPNVGKSTLLNALLNEERAIVSSKKGTTRDVVEGILYINGVKATLQDTAGIRKTSKSIEKKGILKANKVINSADIIILLLDGEKNIKKELLFFNDVVNKHNSKTIIAVTKKDLNNKESEFISISAKENDISSLLADISKYVENKIFSSDINNNAILISENQISIFSVVEKELKNIISLIQNKETLDLVVFELETTLKILSEAIGEKLDQDYIQKLFSSFCLGK